MVTYYSLLKHRESSKEKIKKFLTKQNCCDRIEKLRKRAKGLEGERRVPCKLNNVNQETPWTKIGCFESEERRNSQRKILELEARSE